MANDRTLIDSGVFLEILLDQERSALCRSAIEERSEELTITDFSLHAIGLVLLRNKRKDLFTAFFHDLAPRLRVLTLPVEAFDLLLAYHEKYRLDFDDAYQVASAKFFRFQLLALDSDFTRAKDEVPTRILR